MQIENVIYKMHELVIRNAQNLLMEHLSIFPAVAILGPRQCGKSTLARMVSGHLPNFLYLDLQYRVDLAKLNEPELFFQHNRHSTICLDEVQQLPDIFSVLRSEIDKDRRKGRFILLGSASRELIQKSSETLAGRIGYIELTPFISDELDAENLFDLKKYWYRGGYPESYLTQNDYTSALWRENFIRTYVERDIPQLGFNISAKLLTRMLIMTAHGHGQLFNASGIGQSLGVTHPTVKRYLDIFEQTFFLRVLPPFEKNTRKRLVKSPKVYVRDSGLLHQLLQISDFNALMGHPVYGSSWEGMVIENICSSLPMARFSFYRSAVGEEIDLIVEAKGKLLAVECKASPAPQLTKEFLRALEFIKPHKCFVVAPVTRPYTLHKEVQVCGINHIVRELRSALNSDN